MSDITVEVITDKTITVEIETTSIDINTGYDPSTPYRTFISKKTNDYTIVPSDRTILADGTSNIVTITLPSAVGLEGLVFEIKCINETFLCDLATYFTQEIDGDSSNMELLLHEVVRVKSDNANWWII